MNWAQRIAAAKEASGLSQKELGDKIGKSQQMVGDYITGKSQPTLEIFEKIAKATEYQYAWLVLGIGNPSDKDYSEDVALDRDIVRECIIVLEILSAKTGLHFSPTEKADLILSAHALARKEGGVIAVQKVFARVLARTENGG